MATKEDAARGEKRVPLYPGVSVVSGTLFLPLLAGRSEDWSRAVGTSRLAGGRAWRAGRGGRTRLPALLGAGGGTRGLRPRRPPLRARRTHVTEAGCGTAGRAEAATAVRDVAAW